VANLNNPFDPNIIAQQIGYSMNAGHQFLDKGLAGQLNAIQAHNAKEERVAIVREVGRAFEAALKAVPPPTGPAVLQQQNNLVAPGTPIQQAAQAPAAAPAVLAGDALNAAWTASARKNGCFNCHSGATPDAGFDVSTLPSLPPDKLLAALKRVHPDADNAAALAKRMPLKPDRKTPSDPVPDAEFYACWVPLLQAKLAIGAPPVPTPPTPPAPVVPMPGATR
jgi:hypothetical protein